MDWLMTVAKEYGLFVALVCYVLFDSRQREIKYINREEKYQSIISTLSNKFEIIESGIVRLENKVDTWIKR